MRSRNLTLAMAAALTLITAAYGFQRGRMFFEEEENSPAPMPADAGEKTEFVFARLKYPSFRGGSMGWSMRGNWTVDWPKADRQFVQGVRRLSRVHIRSVEQVVDLESDDIFNYPFLYVVEPGHWDLPDNQAKKLREYLLRGGFMMTDDFHGSFEWDIFMDSMSRVMPEHAPLDIQNNDAIFHVLYDLDERFQVPGIIMFYTGRTYEYDGVEARWRAIYDDKGRIMAAIGQNMDLGDAWEWADHPRYPERYASLAYRVGINYITYAMTH